MGRHCASLLSRTFRRAYRRRCIDIWQRNEIVDDQTAERLRSSSRLWSRPLYWLGLIPGAAGRGVQRLWGNRIVRRNMRRAIFHRSVRREFFSDYCARKTAQWRRAGRISPQRTFHGLTARFAWNCLLAKLTPRELQRWLTDRVHRRTQLMQLMLLVISGRFQREYGRHAIRRSIRDWSAAGRLHRSEQVALERESQSHELDEYARCFGLHLSLKLILPILIPLKIGGLAAFATTGKPVYLLPLIVTPVARTMITLWRMARNRWRGVRYGEALAVGILPFVGSLAFPVQMYAAHKKLAIFLIRDNAARLARWIPIYGGRNSRLEVAAVKAADVPIELLDIGLSLMTRIRSWFPHWKSTKPSKDQSAALSTSGWDRLVDHHLRLLAQSEAAYKPVSEQIDDLVEQQTRYRRAS